MSERLDRVRLIRDLRYLVSVFPPGTKSRLVWLGIAQFLVSLLDVLGLTAVIPVIQVVNGGDYQSGYIGRVHAALGSPDRAWFVAILCALMIVAFALKGIASLVIAWWSGGLTARLQVHTSATLLASYLTEPYLRQRRRDASEVVRTVETAVNSAVYQVLGGVIACFGQLLSVLFIMVFLAVVSPTMTAVTVVYFGLTLAIIQWVLGRRNRLAGRQAQEAARERSRHLLQSVYGAREIRMHDAEDIFVARFREASETAGVASRNSNFYAQAPKYVLEFAMVLGIALMLLSGSFAGDSNEALPLLAVFVAAAVRLLPVATALSTTVGNIKFGQEGLTVACNALRRTGPAGAGGGRRVGLIPDGSPGLEVEHVTFRYPDGQSNAVDDVTFAVPPGTSIALCGASGSGKTTVVDLILGLLTPTGGVVRYGGEDVAALGEHWRSRVGYVPQDVYLLQDTLVANVAFGVANDEIDLDRVTECIQSAHLTDFVAGLPDGISTKLGGSDGVQVSGGQRQRLGIARALYRDPAVLVLDEATSALDNETEDRISRVLRELSSRVITVVVAHRLSTVKHVDEVLYMCDGHVVGRGGFSELRRTLPEFDRLVRLGNLDA